MCRPLAWPSLASSSRANGATARAAARGSQAGELLRAQPRARQPVPTAHERQLLRPVDAQPNTASAALVFEAVARVPAQCVRLHACSHAPEARGVPESAHERRVELVGLHRAAHDTRLVDRRDSQRIARARRFGRARGPRCAPGRAFRATHLLLMQTRAVRVARRAPIARRLFPFATRGGPNCARTPRGAFRCS